MIALTLCQPYASAVLHICEDGHPLKTVENRTWRTDYRGPLLIHAGLSRGWMEHYTHDRFDPLRPPGTPAGQDGGIHLPFGAILGQVRLVDCVPYAVGLEIDPIFASGPWCFPRPIPCKGARNFWPVSENVLRRIEPVQCPASCAQCADADCTSRRGPHPNAPVPAPSKEPAVTQLTMF
jgi:hypothetical protein